MLNKLKDNILTVGIIVLVLGIGIAVGTYAYYQTTVTGSVGATVLAWDCKLGSSGVVKSTFANMYPGSSGSITFNITSSIAADYTIHITGFTNMNSGTHAALKLYTDSAHSTVIATNTNLTGSISAGGTASKVIYYYWPYGTAAETYSNAVPSFTYSITCNQK